ncbi:MAG: prephenate dehydratase [Lachnospiraceae bacterium]|nr:prephenate dehydratase [Lachnospiraceae bacterium]
MRDLNDIRKDIDEVDAEILAAFEKRIELSDQVAEYKRSKGLPVYDVEREKEKIASLSAKVEGDFMKKGVRELFTDLMGLSKKKQYRLLSERAEAPDGFIEVEHIDFSDSTVVFQGVEGAYSEEAMRTFFGQIGSSFNVGSFYEAMKALADGRAGYAILPLENSRAGSVRENYDLLTDFNLAIVGEEIIPIRHNLLAVPGAALTGITDVYSHPQALMQCSGFFKEHPEIVQHPMANTAIAAKTVAEAGDPTKAAIAGAINAELYGLCVLSDSIADDPDNKTRFVVLSRKKIYEKKANMVSVEIELPDIEGSLYRMLSHFVINDLNMHEIESRPIRGRDWEYRFFIDFTGNLSNKAVQNAILGLREETKKLVVLGNYVSSR